MSGRYGALSLGCRLGSFSGSCDDATMSDCVTEVEGSERFGWKVVTDGIGRILSSKSLMSFDNRMFCLPIRYVVLIS